MWHLISSFIDYFFMDILFSSTAFWSKIIFLRLKEFESLCAAYVDQLKNKEENDASFSGDVASNKLGRCHPHA